MALLGCQEAKEKLVTNWQLSYVVPKTRKIENLQILSEKHSQVRLYISTHVNTLPSLQKNQRATIRQERGLDLHHREKLHFASFSNDHTEC